MYFRITCSVVTFLLVIFFPAIFIKSATIVKYIKDFTNGEIFNCCENGVYYENFTNLSCVGLNSDTQYAFVFPIVEIYHLDQVVLDDNDTIENYSVCSVDVLVENGTTVSKHFVYQNMDEMQQISNIVKIYQLWLYPVSIAFLIATLYIYKYELTELHSNQDIAFMCAILCLALWMVFEIVAHTWEFYAYYSPYIYYVGHYCKTAFMAWFNVMLMSRVFENRNLTNLQFFSIDVRRTWMQCYGWLMPIVLIIIYCHILRLDWRIPILCLWIANIFLLAGVFATMKDDREESEKRNRYRSWLLFRLFLGTGIPWIFKMTYMPFFSSLFALQGVLIFLIMVVYRNHAQLELAGFKLFGFTFPRKWERLPVIDDDEVPVSSGKKDTDESVNMLMSDSRV